MKRLSILMSVAAMLAVGCYDDSQILNRMEDLEESMTSSNEEMAALKERLQELEENVYVTGVSQIMAEGSADVTGYTIALSNGESIVIRHGKDGTPGADGLTPTVTVSGNEVLIQIGDDEPVRIPYRPAFSLNIGSGSVTVIAGATVEVPYTLTGADAATVVYAMADGGYDAEVVAESETAGKIKITAPSVYADGKVIVFAGNNVQAAMAVLSFEEGSISVDDKKIEVSKDGGAVEIPVSTNLGYQVSVSADWVSYVETRAMRNETVVLNVDPNTGLQRTATVSFMVGEMSVLEVEVVQAQAGEPEFVLADLYGDWTVSYGSSGNTYTWKFAESDDPSKGNATLVNIFGTNKHNQKVYVNFDLYTGVISIAMGQDCEDNWGYISGTYLDAKEGADVVEYTMTKDGMFGNPTATIGYAGYGSLYLDNVSAVKVDPNALAVGNYYYSDGTCSSLFHTDKTLVGVVFWLGDATATDPVLKTDFPNCTNGLAVAVAPVNDIKWQTNAASVATWQQENASEYTSVSIPYNSGALNLDRCLGYSNTKVLQAYNEANPEAKADVYENLVTFAETTSAPQGTSGWYIPSAKEVSYICSGANSNAYYASGTANLTAINEKLQAAGLTKITFSYIASSTEIEESTVWGWQSSYLGSPDKSYSFTLLPVFAF